MCQSVIVSPSNHAGHIILEHLKNYPYRLYQIDAARKQQETRESVLKRSIQLAKCLRNFGLVPGDVLAYSGFNHLDVHIPLFSALFNGLPASGVDPYLKYSELRLALETLMPKIIFCDASSYELYCKVADDIKLSTKIVKFGRGSNSMTEFIETYNDTTPQDEFRVAEFDTQKIYCFLITTSGTTGKTKMAAISHQAVLTKMIAINFKSQISECAGTMLISPVNWISSYFIALSTAITGHCRIQTSVPDDIDIVVDMINKYKPLTALLSPSAMASILQQKDKVDLTCFKMIFIGGAKVHPQLLAETQKCMMRGGVVLDSYGQTETVGYVLMMVPGTPVGSSGVPHMYDIKLADPETGMEINEPNITGEMLVKGPCFSEYYNNPIETAKSFTKDGYFKTGDLWYRDSKGFYYFVDRLKCLIKYKNFQVEPLELEDVISTHEGVSDVCVVGVPDPIVGQLPVACVVRKPGVNVTARDIKELVAKNLSKHKHLNGGVVFLKELPMTSTGKKARAKILELILDMKRE